MQLAPRLRVVAVAAVLAAAAHPAAQPQEVRPSFAEFLDGVRAEALQRGIRQEIIDASLSNIKEPVPVVIERDRSQAETVLSLEAYVTRRLTATLVRSGRAAYAKHRALLTEVAEHYGVPASIIVGIWGMESNFGGFSGVRPTVAALATLAWDPRRSAFFRGELFAALDILNRGDIEVSQMKGSWAGAMGQLQFMPSSYLKFAEDYDSDGRRDIWSSAPDIFASVGNYLKGNGWDAGGTWGREVKVPAEAAAAIDGLPRRIGNCKATREMTVAMPMTEWQRLGLRLPNGQNLPASAPDASLVSGTSRHFLVYHNYDALLEYNCSHSYAISVALLAARIEAPTAPPAPAARKAKATPPVKSRTTPAPR